MNGIELNGKTIDIGKAFPFTLGDWKELEKLDVYPRDTWGGHITVTKLATLAWFTLHKVNDAVTMEEMDTLPINGKKWKEILTAFREQNEKNKEDEVDENFTEASTSSPEPTDGHDET